MPLSTTTVLPAVSCTSGRGKVGSGNRVHTHGAAGAERAAVGVADVDGLRGAHRGACEPPETAGNAAASVITATPPVSCARLGIMKMLDSNPLGRNDVAPSIWPLPDWRERTLAAQRIRS